MSSTWHWNCRNYYTTCFTAPVYEQPNQPSAVEKSCSVCMNPIHTRYADLAYHCTNPSWGNVCHLAATCSRFINPRGNTRACTLSTRIWHCHLHSSPSATLYPSLSPDNSPPRPTPPSSKSLLNQGLSLVMQRIQKKSVLSALLLYVLTLSQWGAVYVPRDSIRNAALDRKLQLVTIFGNVENAPTFNRTVRWNLQIVCFLALLTHFLPNLYLLLHEISWKSINGMLTVFVQNSWNFVTTFLTLTSTFWLFRNQNYGKLIKLHPLKVMPQSENIKTTSLEAVFYSSSKQTSCSRSYTLSKKLAWRSYPFVSRLLNHLGLISTTSIYQIPQLNIICSTLP